MYNDMRKILLNKSRGTKSVNNPIGIPVEINRDTSLFHDEIMSDTIDTMKIYNEEKDNSKKHRLIFTVNPICTNSLFNRLTEVVHNEGSSSAKILFNDTSDLIFENSISKERVSRLQAIRNTEYTNSEYNLTYHCGADIFNNHLLRSKEDISVQKRVDDITESPLVNELCRSYKLYTSNDSYTTKDGFNTIGDFARTHDGGYIITTMPDSKNHYVYSDSENRYEGLLHEEKLPLYLYDTIKDFKTAFGDGILRKDGWIGFNNPSTMPIPIIDDVNKKYYVNKCFNNKESCQFIDMSPERDLFYFTPKKNINRKRLEYNWDYFLTYPSESIYDDGIILKGKGYGLPLNTFENGSYYDEYNENSGLTLLMFRCPVKHNLKPGDTIFLKTSDNKQVKCTVKSIGTSDRKNKDRYFSVYKTDVEDYLTINDVRRFSKVVSGFECEYYYRKFSKFDKNFNSTLTKLSFSNTIYGDEVSQIVFTDDIDVSDYKDNRGRPLAEIYLTVIKTNRGYKQWYENNNPKDANVEYSHVFGCVTSGLDLPEYVDISYPVVRRQHNINKGESMSFKLEGEELPIILNKSSKKIETDIDKNFKAFYGDLVEFNPVEINETVLENVYHRFNTAQRETMNSKYSTIYYDEIKSDIFDANYRKAIRNRDTSKQGDETLPQIMENKLHEGFANLEPEGYIYNPHHKITIGAFSKIVNQLSDGIMKVEQCELTQKSGYYQLTFITNKNYTLLPYDIVGIMDKNNQNMSKFIVDSYSFDSNNNYYICVCNCKNEDIVISNINEQTKYFFKHNITIPDYAYMLPDGTGRHLWRDLIKPSEYSFMDDLYNIPFTNGSFYHHTNIMFFVRRQDPFQKYGMVLHREGETKQFFNNFNIPSIEANISNDEYVKESDYKTCL